jgi:hypothetical protein
MSNSAAAVANLASNGGKYHSQCYQEKRKCATMQREIHPNGRTHTHATRSSLDDDSQDDGEVAIEGSTLTGPNEEVSWRTISQEHSVAVSTIPSVEVSNPASHLSNHPIYTALSK